MLLKAHSVILLSLRDKVPREVFEDEFEINVWEKLWSLFLKRSLENHFILKKQLCTFQMEDAKHLKKDMDELNKIILNLKNMDVKIEEENHVIILFSSLLKNYEHIVDTMLYGKKILTMTKVNIVLMSKEIRRKSEIKKRGTEKSFLQGKTWINK